jgi:hypothetical protein
MSRRIFLALALGLVVAAAGAGHANAGPTPPGWPGSGGGGGRLPGGPDPLFTFTFTDLAGDVGNGTLSAIDSGLGDGSLLVTSGTLNLTSSSDGNASVGTYSLIAVGPAITGSPSGLFAVDDLIYPNNDAANGVSPNIGSNPSYLTNWGLLFGHPGSGSQDEINIWGNGNGDYAFGSEMGGNYNILQLSGGTFTLTPVPEPTSLCLLGIGLSGLAVFALRGRKAGEA